MAAELGCTADDTLVGIQDATGAVLQVGLLERRRRRRIERHRRGSRKTARAGRRVQGRSICLWQYSQSALIEVPSFALWLPSWQRKHPDDVMWPRLSGYVPNVTFIVGKTFRR